LCGWTAENGTSGATIQEASEIGVIEVGLVRHGLFQRIHSCKAS
jgi:hypothetical protein